MDTAARVKTRKGNHYWFRIPADWNEERGIASWSVHVEGGVSFDFRADDTGVIVPPSVHESGHVYTWERPLSEASVAPLAILDGSLRGQAPGAAPASGEGLTIGTGGATRSMLSALLAKPPTEGGRNDWLTRVAGHYAKTYHNQEDLYLTHVQAANALLPQPLDEEEFIKTTSSVWRGEHERNPRRALDGDCGFLQSAGTRLMVQVANSDAEGHRTYDLAEFADFDLVCKGVMVGDDQSRTYWVQIVRSSRAGAAEHDVIDGVLPAAVCGDDRRLRLWLANYACTVTPPGNMFPKDAGSTGVRVQRYLESQRPPAVKVTRTLGWDAGILNGSGGYVTHTGVITPDEVFTPEAVGVRPDPALLVGGVAPHHYGFEWDGAEARRILSEVLTFHHDATTSVFGAWWAACLLKPQLQAKTALFPFMAVEAPSESGKTNGFFQMMTELNGNTQGETQPTRAALRDMSASHRNGIVWIDDLDDIDYLGELLRASTSNGTITKMGEDRESVKNTQIVAPIVISGEALGLGSQKALLDRAVILKVDSPTSRRSLRDPERPQWDDILSVREDHPEGLSTLAGWYVQEALAVQVRAVGAVRAERRGGSGRVADKLAILRVGARLLDHLSSDPADGDGVAWSERGGVHYQRVDQWIQEQSATGAGSSENTLTLLLLPWALRTFKYPDKAYAAKNDRDLDVPVFVKHRDRSVQRAVQGLLGQEVTAKEDGPEIWFNTSLLAQAWEREKHGRVERRTQTDEALKDQAHALGTKPTRVRVANGGGRLAYYRKIDGALAAQIMARAEGQ
jgi:hypothetical protein